MEVVRSHQTHSQERREDWWSIAWCEDTPRLTHPAGDTLPAILTHISHARLTLSTLWQTFNTLYILCGPFFAMGNMMKNLALDNGS